MLSLAKKDLKLAVNPDAFRLIDKINRLLSAEGIPAYLAGGFVRDWLLERDTADIDIVVGADALKIARKVAVALRGKNIPLDIENGVSRVAIPGERYHLDFTTLRGNIEQDLARRDFTVNAIALPLDENFKAEVNKPGLIDPCGGWEDLRHRILKAVDPGVFAADPLRLLRALRLAAELGLCIEHVTETRIRQRARLITTVAGERVRGELLRLLALPGAGQRLSYLDWLGLLPALIPELEPARGTSQPGLHVWDVLTHSIRMVTAVEFLLRESTWDYAGLEILAIVPWSEELDQHFQQEISSGCTRKTLLKLAALLHDVAKPGTKSTDTVGRTRFLGHPQEGATTAAAIMSRLRFSRREIEHVELLVKYHLRPTQMSNEGVPTHRAIYRYFRDTGDTGIDLLFLSLADHLATRGATLDWQQWQEHTEMTREVLATYLEQTSSPPPARLVDGNTLMKVFRLEPGPMIGEMLEAVKEAQATGEITSKKEALLYLKRRLAGENNPRKNRVKE
jgi:poly(A) polymerase